MAKAPGSFIWYELMTTDMDAAEAFYAQVVGWTASDSGQSQMRYTLMSADSGPAAGIFTIPESAKGAGPVWLGQIWVEDLSEALTSAKGAGAAVHVEPEAIPGVGRMAMIADPQGVVLGLFQPEGLPGEAPHQMTPGQIGWHELMTTDRGAAWSFYTGEFGWAEVDRMDMGEMGIYQMFGWTAAAPGEDMAAGAMMTAGSDWSGPPVWQFYFTVPDIDAAKASVEANGGTVTSGPMEVPGGAWILNGIDPQGAAFALVAGPKGDAS
ncbi:VOC family protein [Pacificimonas flava]|uniref:VOC domain-containing protein n=1 Tax=Pacificimonas flava TaxID=1234595 RepID=M2T6R2_9SPHN|nr:VOC family protein [Pacificimonas flava]EMD82219.1 hypothetical protein C725_2505 [Pacificimonas flava]MBB5280303.1 hypothetical protein [Pacificimonas flava]